MAHGRPFEDVRYGDPINRHEARVAIGILFGRTCQQIADDLFRCLRTIHCYRYRLYKKYGVHNATDLCNALMEYPMAAPTIHLHVTNLQDQTVEISVNGKVHRYQFMTCQEIDTLKYLFKLSGLKALNYAKRHSEMTTVIRG
jgi:DNA-binding CsgD family transcriptional regulator